MPRSAFTLIELLVSITIAMILAGLAWTGLVQLKRSAERSQAAAGLALEAGLLYRRFDDDVARTLQQTQMRVETPSLDATVYGAGARAVRIVAMCEMYERTVNRGVGSWQAGDIYGNTALWYCWEWRPPTAAELLADAGAAGSLWYGRTSTSARTNQLAVNAVNATTGATGSVAVTFRQVAQSWRSRKADFDINDLRLVEGAAFAPAIRLRGDRTELLGEDLDRDGVTDPGEDTDGNGVLSRGQLGVVSRQVASCSISWVDYGGWTTTASSAGVVVTDATGSVVPPTGDPWWTASARAVDGLYRDARTELADGGRTVLQSRPGLIRFELVLTDRQTGLSRPLRFAIAPDLGVPAATGL